MLHIVNRSPFISNALTDCLKVIQANDVLLLIEDGVLGATSKFGKQLQRQQKIFQIALLKNDVMARGIEQKVAALPMIEYLDFVTLTEQHYPCITWS